MRRRNTGGSCRYDKQRQVDANGHRVVQVNAEALIDAACTGDVRNETTVEEDTAIVFTIAPHMFHEIPGFPDIGFAWMFSTTVKHEVYTHTRPWVLSTFQ